MERNNPNKKDVIIIGGGASGLFAALLIKSENEKLSVAVLESSDRVGKKLLVTGNGRCNLTNVNLTPEMYHGSFKYCAEHLLKACPPQKIIDIFGSFGLPTTIEQGGLVYPRTKQANSVLDILRLNLKNYSVEIYTGTKVNSISAHRGGYQLKTASGDFFGNKVIVATGGKAASSTGADVSIFEALKKMGHTITPLYPTLCPVTVKSPYLKSLKGLRVKAKVSLVKDNRVIKSESGELQFAENALSGICIFNLSRLANTMDNTGISVNLYEGFSVNDILTLFEKKLRRLKGINTAEDLLTGMFSKMLSLALLKESGILPSSPVSELDKNSLNKLAETITDFRFTVLPHKDFSKAQVTAGGVPGKEIDMFTMESKLFRGLYIVGEATDCDGDCGGANLQYAFASAYTAAKDILS